jgi:HTH-type transcriptional regulator/antitoxin HigA
MAKITQEQYEFALARIEELLPMVDDNTPANDRNAAKMNCTPK